ncbi:MAG: 4Fe-4S binding protein [Endomicrobiaceae bacterium]
MKIKIFKISVQLISFVIICFLLWYLRYPLHHFFNAALFFQLSPVITIVSNFLSAAIIPALILIIITFIFGRIFCGWICPYGTVMDIVSFFTDIFKKNKETSPKKKSFKYFLLAFLILLTACGFQLFWLFEPITIFARGFYFTFYSAANNLSNDFFYYLMSNNPGRITEGVYQISKSIVIENRELFFSNSLLMFMVFILPLFMLLFKRRFWCRYICPLGAILSIIAAKSLLERKSGECIGKCGQCKNLCRMNAIKDDNTYIKQECILCMDCIRETKCINKYKSVFSFKKPDICNLQKEETHIKKKSENGISRKEFLSWLTVSMGFLFIALKNKSAGTNNNIIRPPGTSGENDLKQKCIRCGNCIKACVTNGLQPVMLESGPDGIWTPKLDAKTGYCEYECVLCGHVCPTQAIKKLTVKEKMKTKIGIAKIQKNACISWHDGLECLVCEEHCPIPEKAVKVKKEIINGELVKVPYIEERLCIGCSICQNKCPVEGAKGIIVESL